MSNVKFNALASLALLAGAPVAAQAAMTEMADVEMSDVSGQGLISDAFGAIGSALFDPLINSSAPGVTTQSQVFESCTGTCVWTDSNSNGKIDPTDTFSGGSTPTFVLKTTTTGAVVDNNYLPKTIGKAAGESVDNANKGLINFGLLPLNLFGDAVGATTDSVRGAGRSIIGFGLLPLTAPTAAVGAFNARVVSDFAITGQSVADTASRILTTPIRAVVNPINGALDDAAALGKGLVSGARFSAVGAVGGATTRVLAGAAQQTNSRFLTNLAYASDQARVQQQAKIGATAGVTVTVPKPVVSTSLLSH